MKNVLCIEGILRFRTIPPEWTPEQYTRYWCPMSERQRDRYTVHETHNLLTNAGRTLLLTYIGSASGSTTAFAQYFSVGTGSYLNVAPSDTSVSGENFRVAPSSTTISGTQIDIQSQIGSSQAVGTLTNAGLFGNGATSTLGTGTLYTHALINNFVKANGAAYSVDYLINLL